MDQDLRLTEDETRFLLQQKDVLDKLSSFNRVRAGRKSIGFEDRFQTEVGSSVDLLNRARTFEGMMRSGR